MNQVEKPTKPGWFVIVEALISVLLLLVIVYVWGWVVTFLKMLGVPPLLAMLAASIIFLVVGHLISQRGKVGKWR